MTPGEAAQFIQAAIQHHRVNQFVEAEDLYRRVLAAYPADLDALHLLGVLLGQTGRAADGVELVTRACAHHSRAAILHDSLGDLLSESGRPGEAIAAYGQSLALDPASAETHNNLGNALIRLARHADAAGAYQAALRIDPRMDRTWANLAVALRGCGRFAEAEFALRKALEIDPRSAIAHDTLGLVLADLGRLDDAIAAHQRSVEIRPDSWIAWSNMSVALNAKKRFDEAIAACRNSIRLNPNYADAYCNMGVALADLGRPHEALTAYRKAVEIRPGFGSAWSNLGVTLRDMGLFADSLAACQKGVDADPANPTAHLNLGVILLQMGQFERGWVEYEWRWQCRGLFSQRPLIQPRWDGKPLEGRTIFLHSDQGLGDTMQFIRYVPLIHQRGGRIILACDSPLRRLLEDFPGIARIQFENEPAPTCDVHCPVVSLPAVFGTNLDTIPADLPYLRAKPRLVEEWRARLAPYEGTRKVGLVWAGRPKHPNDRHRSMTLARFAPLAADRITFFSLQKGEAATQIADVPLELRLVDFSEELFDLADTAGLIANLDLVISVDTSVVHLAGAMSRPVWTLLPHSADWRWLIDREDTPWYPTMRLFRQRSPGDWDEVIERVARELRI